MLFGDYLKELQANLGSGHATEPTHYLALKRLLEELDPSKQVITNPKHTEVGNPDFRVQRKGHAIDFPVGYIEAKDIGEDLNKWEKDEQIRRYLDAHNFILTDFLEFRWYTDGKQRLTARLGAREGHRIRIEASGEAAVHELLLAFFAEQLPTVRTAKELAQRMARLAHLIRGVILGTFSREANTGHLHVQYEAFKQTLIPDLKPDQFSDMYAQTIAYGLFAARCQPAPATQAFTRANAADLIPKTNPFLRKLFQEVAGVDLPEEIRPFVDDLVALLRSADLDIILADFGKRAAKEDPVVHFYEDFLREYDPKEKKLRGVYYTPEPVVLYIVRSIDHLLKTRFNRPDGLADPNVLILDPACGTGTFLYYVIDHIHKHLCAKGQQGTWNSYVSQNLLKRVFGFELLMAPYAVAHLKLGLLLQELGYRFDTDERLGIYLTNTLEEAIKRSEIMFAQWIADEANAASEIKRDKPIMVVLGNPPYSGHSANKGPWIRKLIEDYKTVDGKPLGEKNPKWLQDDYVKFIRFGQWRINKTGYGILAYISNNGYLDNPTFRGMRQQLLREFTEIYLLDLHGSSKKKERAPDGGKEENVFDIQQGVAIGLYVKQQGAQVRSGAHHADLWGQRESKYYYLNEADCASTPWTPLHPISSLYLFAPRKTALLEEYERGWKLSEIFPLTLLGPNSHRDDFAIAFDHETAAARIKDLADASLSDDDLRIKHKIRDTRDWRLREARQSDLKAAKPTRCIYRPFDFRFMLYGQYAFDYHRPEINDHLLQPNLALISTRQTKEPFAALATALPAGQHKLATPYDGSYLSPLYVYARQSGKTKEQIRLPTDRPDGPRPNLNDAFVAAFTHTLGRSHRKRKRKGARPRDTFSAQDAFDYIYAILHSPSFRKRYQEFLKADFARIPLTSDQKLFRALVEKGRELVSLHLMESPKLSMENFITQFPVSGDNIVEKVRWEPDKQIPRQARDDKQRIGGRVWINKEQYFDGVPKNVWEFHIGGYQVCEKWLKDRQKAGRTLSADDIAHYQKIVVALNETLRLMREIDDVIPGWPLR